MSSSFAVWRRYLWTWVLPLGFCILNLLGIAVYRYAFAGKVETLESRYQRATDELAKLKEERRVIEDFLLRVEAHREKVRGLYVGYFQTEQQRFTRVVLDVKNLARQAGLEPTTFSYPRKNLGDLDLVERSIQFSVTGTYDQLRRFINFLELSEHFVALNSVTLGESGDNPRDPILGINLSLTTIFAARETEDRSEEPTT